MENRISVEKEKLEAVVTNFLIVTLGIIENCQIFFLTELVLDIINNFEEIQKKSWIDPDSSKDIVMFNIDIADFENIKNVFDISKNGTVIQGPKGEIFLPFDIESWVKDAQDDMQYLADSLI